MIRKTATVGDVIIGVSNSSLSKKMGFRGIIYTMFVNEKLTYDQYWSDPRFFCKKPILNGSAKQFYGDNIYHREGGVYVQENSHHSNDDGSTNYRNYNRDLKSEHVLCSSRFWYWGRTPIEPPEELSILLFKWRGYSRLRGEDNPQLVGRFVEWINSLDEKGIIGFPERFDLGFIRYNGK